MVFSNRVITRYSVEEMVVLNREITRYSLNKYVGFILSNHPVQCFTNPGFQIGNHGIHYRGIASFLWGDHPIPTTTDLALTCDSVSSNHPIRTVKIKISVMTSLTRGSCCR